MNKGRFTPAAVMALGLLGTALTVALVVGIHIWLDPGSGAEANGMPADFGSQAAVIQNMAINEVMAAAARS